MRRLHRQIDFDDPADDTSEKARPARPPITRRPGFLAKDPLAFIYIATVLARRVNNANRALIELKRQLQAGEPHSVIAETIAEIDCSLVYAGYPFNPLSRH